MSELLKSNSLAHFNLVFRSLALPKAKYMRRAAVCEFFASQARASVYLRAPFLPKTSASVSWHCMCACGAFIYVTDTFKPARRHSHDMAAWLHTRNSKQHDPAYTDPSTYTISYRSFRYISPGRVSLCAQF